MTKDTKALHCCIALTFEERSSVAQTLRKRSSPRVSRVEVAKPQHQESIPLRSLADCQCPWKTEHGVFLEDWRWVMLKGAMVPRNNRFETSLEDKVCEHLYLTWVPHKQKLQRFTEDLFWVMCYVMFKAKFYQAGLSSWAGL